MKWLATLTLMLIITLPLASPAAARLCRVAWGDPDIDAQVVENVVLGTITRPDAGSGTITIATNGTRTIPPNLNINDPSKEVFHQARVVVTGGQNCFVRIDIQGVGGNLSNVTVEGAGAYNLTAFFGIRIAQLDGTGNFELVLGVSALITATGSGNFSDNFNIRVRYLGTP